jgi:tetratricopeptide (TPR) repeat protein
MVMKEADELFSQAYALDVVDERPREAIDLCRKVLEIAPDHYRARVFLGMLLDDQGNEAEKLESRQQFVEAIKRAKSLSSLCDSGYEESALHHLGIWERDRGNAQNASLFFLANALLCKSQESHEYLVEGLEPSMTEVAAAIKSLLLKQAKGEESRKGNASK